MSDAELRQKINDTVFHNAGDTNNSITDEIFGLFKLREQQIYEWVENEVIGEDQHIQHFSFHGRSDIRDEFRREQRAILQAKREGKL